MMETIFQLCLIMLCVHMSLAGVCFKKYKKADGGCLKPYNKGTNPAEDCCDGPMAQGYARRQRKKNDDIFECIPCPKKNNKMQLLAENNEIKNVAGHWGEWTPFSPCSETCGQGLQKRKRKCKPVNPGMKPKCDGASREERPCENQPCPVNGGWSDWSEWGNCKKQGFRHRTRVCNNPKPVGVGTFCQGRFRDREPCTYTSPPPPSTTQAPPKIDGGWCEWSSCQKVEGGLDYIFRDCNCPRPRNGGNYCRQDPVTGVTSIRYIGNCEEVGSGSGSGSGSGNGLICGEDGTNCDQEQ